MKTIKEFYIMTINNSTALNTNKNLDISYSDFVCDSTYEIFKIKSMLAGARSLHSETDVIDAQYLIDEAVERLEKLAATIGKSEYSFENIQKTEIS
jgi:hypothetical protein